MFWKRKEEGPSNARRQSGRCRWSMDLFNLWIAAITLHKRTPTHLHALMMDTIMSSMIARGRNFLHVPSSISQVPRAPWVPKSRWDSACHDNIRRFLRIFFFQVLRGRQFAGSSSHLSKPLFLRCIFAKLHKNVTSLVCNVDPLRSTYFSQTSLDR